MKDLKQKLIIQQVDKKLSSFKPLISIEVPQKGWIHTIRTALKMSMRQLAERLQISANSIKDLEKREVEGVISLKSLEETARSLNMKLVYGFVPLDGSLEKMIEKQALKIAQDIVRTTSNTMALEDQKNSDKRIKEAIASRAEQLVAEMPRHLWD